MCKSKLSLIADIITYDPELLAQKERQKQKYVMPVKSLPPLLGSKVGWHAIFICCTLTHIIMLSKRLFVMQTRIESTLTIEEVTEDTSRQTLEGAPHNGWKVIFISAALWLSIVTIEAGDVEIHIFGLGRIAENVIVDNLHKALILLDSVLLSLNKGT